jgi:hypothetical protein
MKPLLPFLALAFVFLTVVGSAQGAPRKNEKQPELDYHQPVVPPASNKNHKIKSAADTSAALSSDALSWTAKCAFGATRR